MRNRIVSLAEALLGLALIVALVYVITSFSSAGLSRVTQVDPPSTDQAICQPVAAESDFYVSTADTITPLTGEPISGPALLSGQKDAVVATGSEAIVGGARSQSGDQVAWSSCEHAAVTGTIVVPAPQDSELILTNPDNAGAVVDLNIRSGDGEVASLGTRGISVSPVSSTVVPLSVLVESNDPVSVTFDATRGRVSMLARSADDRLAAVGATEIGTEFYLSGVPTESSQVELLVANVGESRTGVEISAYGQTLDYQPVDNSSLSVGADEVITVDLGEGLGGEASSLRLTTEEPVAVTLVVGDDKDQSWSRPVQPAEILGAAVPAGGKLQLSAPPGDDVTALVLIRDAEDQESEEEVVIPGGGTIQVETLAEAAEYQLVSVSASREVFGAITYGAAYHVALQPAGKQLGEAVSAELDPELR